MDELSLQRECRLDERSELGTRRIMPRLTLDVCRKFVGRWYIFRDVASLECIGWECIVLCVTCF